MAGELENGLRTRTGTGQGGHVATKKHAMTQMSASCGRPDEVGSRASRLMIKTYSESVTWELGLFALAEAIRADSVAASFRLKYSGMSRQSA